MNEWHRRVGRKGGGCKFRISGQVLGGAVDTLTRTSLMVRATRMEKVRSAHGERGDKRFGGRSVSRRLESHCTTVEYLEREAWHQHID